MSTELEILRSCKTIAVVGLSSDARRPSYEVAEYMQRAGYRIIPVNPAEVAVLGETAYATLEKIPERVDCVDVFRRPEFVPAIAAAAVAIGARALWLQLGVTHEQACQQARASGLLVVEDRCLLIEHRRYSRQLGSWPR